MGNFRGQDKSFVGDWLVQQGLKKIVDVFKLKVCFLSFNKANFKANSESVYEVSLFATGRILFIILRLVVIKD